MYKSVADIGLDNNCTLDQIITALSNKGYAMLIAPIYKTDFPNLNLASSGQKHVLKIYCPILGYVAICDYDISNGTSYFTGHNGSVYTPWTSTKPL